MNGNAAGIDVFKRKSTVAILRSSGKVVAKPFDVSHLSIYADLCREISIPSGIPAFH